MNKIYGSNVLLRMLQLTTPLGSLVNRNSGHEPPIDPCKLSPQTYDNRLTEVDRIIGTRGEQPPDLPPQPRNDGEKVGRMATTQESKEVTTQT